MGASLKATDFAPTTHKRDLDRYDPSVYRTTHSHKKELRGHPQWPLSSFFASTSFKHFSTKCSFQPSVLFNHVRFSTKCSFQTRELFNHVRFSNTCAFQPRALFNQVRFSTKYAFQPRALFKHILFSTTYAAFHLLIHTTFLSLY
jgi:hypothetical protein